MGNTVNFLQIMLCRFDYTTADALAAFDKLPDHRTDDDWRAIDDFAESVDELAGLLSPVVL